MEGYGLQRPGNILRHTADTRRANLGATPPVATSPRDHARHSPTFGTWFFAFTNGSGVLALYSFFLSSSFFSYLLDIGKDQKARSYYIILYLFRILIMILGWSGPLSLKAFCFSGLSSRGSLPVLSWPRERVKRSSGRTFMLTYHLLPREGDLGPARFLMAVVALARTAPSGPAHTHTHTHTDADTQIQR